MRAHDEMMNILMQSNFNFSTENIASQHFGGPRARQQPCSIRFLSKMESTVFRIFFRSVNDYGAERGSDAASDLYLSK